MTCRILEKETNLVLLVQISLYGAMIHTSVFKCVCDRVHSGLRVYVCVFEWVRVWNTYRKQMLIAVNSFSCELCPSEKFIDGCLHCNLSELFERNEWTEFFLRSCSSVTFIVCVVIVYVSKFKFPGQMSQRNLQRKQS